MGELRLEACLMNSSELVFSGLLDVLYAGCAIAVGSTFHVHI